jgi:hypothetical protein
MPTVFEKDFSFTATITGPIHVHVRCGSGEAVFDSRKGNCLARIARIESESIIQSSTACRGEQATYDQEVA